MKKLTIYCITLFSVLFSGIALGQYSQSSIPTEVPHSLIKFINDLHIPVKYSFSVTENKKNETSFYNTHPKEEDIILNKLNVGGHVFAKNSSDIYLPANSRNGSVQSDFGRKDTMHLINIRESQFVTLRIEYDSVKIAENYKYRPKFRRGTDGLYPIKESYFYESTENGKSTLYVIELVFKNLMEKQMIPEYRNEMKNFQKNMEHLHGHICDPGDPKCLG